MQTEILTEALTSTSSNSLRQKNKKSRNRQNDSICRDKHKTEKIRDPAGKSESRKYVAAFDGAQRL